MKQQRTILHVIDTTGPGGAETVFIDLANELTKRGYKNLALIRGKGWVYDELQRRGIETRIVDCKGSFNLNFLHQLICLIRREKISIIQSHLLGSNIYCSMAGLYTGTPVYATFHGAVDVSSSERLIKLKCFILNLGVTQFISVSEKLQNEIQKIGLLNASKSVVIYNGIETKNYFRRDNLKLKKQLGLSKNAKLIGSLGNVRPAKSYDTLIKAATLAVARDSKLHFVIAGDTTKAQLMSELSAMIEANNLTSNIHFIGYQNDSAAFLGQVDMFLLTSSSEGFSIATLEALASEIPVITTRCGGPEEIYKHSKGFKLVNVGNVQEIANAIVENRSSEKKPNLSIFEKSLSIQRYQALYNNYQPAPKSENAILDGILCVANWDSNVGYAWWLMESYWAKIAEAFSTHYNCILAYPSISTLPENIGKSELTIVQNSFSEQTLRALIRQCRLIKNKKIKHMYLTDWPSYSIRYLFFRMAGVRRIMVHDHTPGLRTPPTGLKKVLKTTLHRLPFINADAYIGATSFVTKRLIEVNRIPINKGHTAQNGLPQLSPPSNARDLNESFGIPNCHTVVIMTGRANRYKGVDFAIRCFAEIVHRRGVNDLHFLFCGDGPDLEFFKLMVKDLNLEKNVTFAGHVKGIAEILAACDFAFHPSQGEVGYSLSILEYMRAALPVVVPDNPSVCSSIVQNETGLIYSEMKLEKCVQALIELYQDKALRKSISTKAMSAFNNNYTLKNTHKQLISTIQKVISQHE